MTGGDGAIVSDISFVASFKYGITFDIFRQEGNTPSVRQALHNSASTGAMTAAADLKYFTSIL